MVIVCLSCSLGCGCRLSWAKVGGGGNVCGRFKFWRIGVNESNSGTIEVVGGGGYEIIEFRRVGGGSGGNLEFGLSTIM